MRLPRSLSGMELAASLHVFGYEITRQTGSHLRLTTEENGEHHITVPRHGSLRVGTLAAILSDIAEHFDISRDEVLSRLSDA